jgi:hypothetical protein
VSPERVPKTVLSAKPHQQKGFDKAFRLVRGVFGRVGLSGLEPLTSALSGQRSNRLSYRPSRWEMPVRAQTKRLSDPERPPQIFRPVRQSSASVISRPPSIVAARL